MTWIKRIIFCFCLFMGLYFYGDFRINDVNVRDQLRIWVPPSTVMFWKAKALDASANAYQAVKTTLADDSLNSQQKTQQDNKPSEEISAEDAKKLKDLMDKLTDE